MKQIKILHTISQINNGGRERRMVQLVRGLYRTGRYMQYIITFSEYIEYKDVLETDAKIIFINYTKLSKIQLFNCLYKLLNNIKPDIVHSWNGGPIDVIIGLLKYKYRFKYVAGFVADGNKLSKYNQTYFIHKFSFLRADKIVSNSRAGLIAKKAPTTKSRIIYNGFDFSRLNTHVTRFDKKKELNLCQQYVVGMIARVSYAKDFMSFIKLAYLASKSLANVHFIAIGGGELLDTCKKKILELQLHNITFLGPRCDIEELLQILDISILFSNNNIHAEGVSNSIMESMAAGIPVIATDGGGTPEIITDNVNGYIIPPADVEKALKLINVLIDNVQLRSNIGIAAKKTIQDRFTLDKMTCEYINLYSELLQ